MTPLNFLEIWANSLQSDVDAFALIDTSGDIFSLELLDSISQQLVAREELSSKLQALVDQPNDADRSASADDIMLA